MCTDGFFIRLLKALFTAFRRFFADRVLLRCSALSFYSILSIVPMLTVLFAVSRGLGISEMLRNALYQQFDDYPEAVDFIVRLADNAMANAGTGWLRWSGMVFLLWSVLTVLRHIERAFNYVWQVQRPRPLLRRFIGYSAFILTAPPVLAFSGSLSLSLRYHAGSLTHGIPLLEHVGPLFGTLVPFILVYLLFTFIYVAVPYTKVRVRPALAAALVTGTAFQLAENLYIFSQLSISKYSAIYGVFAAVPMLCLWLHLSWIIILFGAELTFALQNNFEG
ncbi:MAG: YihY/virulence factor BrkB family protein [Prevotellaceae bacterium]|jgi:membrane protein|nr:YihY/virulence factor BrkB family protein [Prevotellaceae bacterium]